MLILSFLKNLAILLIFGLIILALVALALWLDKVLGRYYGLGITIGLLVLIGAALMTAVTK